MNRTDPFDAMLGDWLEDAARGRGRADLHAETMAALSRVPQRPAWLVALRGGTDAAPRTRAFPALTARRVLLVTALLLLAAALAVTASGWLPRVRLLGVTNGRILIARETAGPPAQYLTVARDGTDELLLFEASECGQCAFWSPDGRRIMYPFVLTDDRLATAIVDPDGGNRVEVSSPDGNLFIGPSGWSSDGRLIVLEGFDPNNQASPEIGVYVANADGSGLRQVTSSTDGRLHTFSTFSPDGRRIAFLQEDTGSIPIGGLHGDLFIVNADGSDLRQVNPVGTKAVVAGPTGRPMAWSPDSRQLALTLVEALDVGRSAAYVVDIAGGTLQRISDFGAWLVAVEWSPDGEWVLYGEVASPNAPTWLVRPDGTAARQLTGPGSAVAGCCATWAPDSSRLLFRQVGGVDSDLWTMDVTGSVLDQITRQPAAYIWYSWARQP